MDSRGHDAFLLCGSCPIHGDEDQGQMESYFVHLAMDLFEMEGGCPQKPIYEIRSPLLGRIYVLLDKEYFPGGSSSSRSTIARRRMSASSLPRRTVRNSTSSGSITTTWLKGLRRS
jgi:hypothetical protein